MPRRSEFAADWLTVITTPMKAIRLASKVRHRAASRNQIQARPAAINGWVAMMTATFAVLVICNDGMKATIASVESDATIQPLRSMATRLRKPARPSVAARNRMMRTLANTPRQNRIVQESWERRRVKKGAVLQATAAAMIRNTPNRRCEWASLTATVDAATATDPDVRAPSLRPRR